jgi:hypothetical protein
MAQCEGNIKTVGVVPALRSTNLARADRMQRSILSVRGDVGFHRKGVFRFTTYEELREWTRQQKVQAAKDLAARRSLT